MPTVEGVSQNEAPEPVEIDLAACGIDAAQAADLRFRLSASAEDWERPEMDVYDYD